MRLAALLLLGLLLNPDPVVYHGRMDGAKKPAELVAADVFREIPEYKKIKDGGLKDGDAEYWVLLNKANERFRQALRKVADDAKYDVVVEKGSAKFGSVPPDITQPVIGALDAK